LQRLSWQMSCIISSMDQPILPHQCFCEQLFIERTTSSHSCFHIQAWVFPLKGGRKLWQIEWCYEAFMCHTLHNLIKHTFPTLGNIKHLILSMLTILSIIKCTFRHTEHWGSNFLPTNMFTKRIKLENKNKFLTHNLCANLALNMCDKFIFTQNTFCPW
jgi:hypothetical protein